MEEKTNRDEIAIELDELCSSMNEYLNRHIGECIIKDKLRDQLNWLKYQIKYYLNTGDMEILKENFNWVVCNFNHDLQLSNKHAFGYFPFAM